MKEPLFFKGIKIIFGEMVSKLEDLEVYRLSVKLAMQIFERSRLFPNSELYSLTSQLNRAARSIPLNISEGWGRRIYEIETKKALVYALGSTEETKTALKLAFDCKFLEQPEYEELNENYRIVAAQLYRLYQKW